MWIPFRVTQRVLSRFDFVDDCWVSHYSVGSHGYAQVGWQVNGKRIVTLAHRVAYLAVNGPIPDDMTVDHTCRNRRCINPTHLRLLTNSDNGRMNGQWAKTHCLRGHEFAGDNLRINRKGHRYCRACAKEYAAARKVA